MREFLHHQPPVCIRYYAHSSPSTIGKLRYLDAADADTQICFHAADTSMRGDFQQVPRHLPLKKINQFLHPFERSL